MAVEGAPGGREERTTGRSEGKAPGAANKKGGVDFSLEVADGRAGEVTREAESSGVTLDRSGYERARFSATAGIRRRDFGASGNLAWDNYGVMIGERIDIEIEVEAVRQPAAAISFLSDIHDLTVPRP